MCSRREADVDTYAIGPVRLFLRCRGLHIQDFELAVHLQQVLGSDAAHGRPVDVHGYADGIVIRQGEDIVASLDRRFGCEGGVVCGVGCSVSHASVKIGHRLTGTAQFSFSIRTFKNSNIYRTTTKMGA